MAQQQHAADVHPDELCPPNKRYDLTDANKKVDLEHVQCPPESKILTNIIKNHPLRFSIAASSFVPWIYMTQFWHTLKEDCSKYRLRFMLDKKEFSLTLDDFRTIFHLPQANDNNHNSFVPQLTFSDMVPFYKQQLGFTMELKTSSSFKTTGLLQPWQTLCKIFSKCLTTRVTGWDQPPLQIMQMMYCFVNNIHIDYAKLLWEGFYYSLHHLTSSILYSRFTKIIVSHYMTIFPKISRRARDMYHNLQDDDIMKNIFNSGRHKDKVGMQIPDWMITEEMKHTEHYRMYAEVFGLDVPLTQSQPTESTQGTHRTPSAPRSPTHKKDTAESSALKRSTVICFCLPERRSTRLTPPVPVPTVEKADEMILQDTLQVSLAEHKSREEQEARENVELVNKHLASEEIEKLEPRSDKESPKVERTNDEEVEVTNVVIPVNVNEEEDEITDEVYELKRRDKGKIVEESRSIPLPTPIRSTRTHTNLELQGWYTYLFEHLKERFLSRKSFDTLADHLQEVMVESLPTMVDTHIKEQVKKQVPEQMKFENLQVPQTTCRPSAVRPKDQDDPHDDAHPEGANSNQEQEDDYDFWTDSYASDDDEIPTKQVSQDIMEEVSLTIDEAKLKKMADEMLRQRCTSGDEHQYHIDQMKNFLQSDIVWESRKEILVSPHPRKTTPLVQSCQRDPEAPALSLINQDLLYLKKGSSGPEKIVLSLHKFPAIIFNDDDIEERTSRWVNKCVKKFNPYARYGVEHWKNPHAKIFYIRKQKEPGKPKEEVTNNQEKDKIEAKTDKTEHGNGNSVKQKSKAKSKPS
ncbi:hypothetical protein Tco_1447602 [Tanacetum coccineum]